MLNLRNMLVKITAPRGQATGRKSHMYHRQSLVRVYSGTIIIVQL
jgi:hypothetical protein